MATEENWIYCQVHNWHNFFFWDMCIIMLDVCPLRNAHGQQQHSKSVVLKQGLIANNGPMVCQENIPYTIKNIITIRNMRHWVTLGPWMSYYWVKILTRPSLSLDQNPYLTRQHFPVFSCAVSVSCAPCILSFLPWEAEPDTAPSLRFYVLCTLLCFSAHLSCTERLSRSHHSFFATVNQFGYWPLTSH